MHRDLKSLNILVKQPNNFHRDNFKLSDFGSVYNADAVSQSLRTTGSSKLGTYPWMALEQHSDTNFKYKKNTDMYSLGIVYYEVLSRVLPFTHSKTGNILSDSQMLRCLEKGHRPWSFDY